MTIQQVLDEQICKANYLFCETCRDKSLVDVVEHLNRIQHAHGALNALLDLKIELISLGIFRFDFSNGDAKGRV